MLRICLIGGIYAKDDRYRATVKWTPETVLESGFKAKGHEVLTFGHGWSVELSQFDVIHVHHLGLGALAAAADKSQVPFVYTSHDGPALADVPEKFSRRLAKYFVMSRADALISFTQAEASFQLRTYPLQGAIQAVIPNGIDVGSFPYVAKKAAEKGEAWRLLYVGQLIALKRVDVLLRALAILPANVELDVVFQIDALQQELQRLTRDLGLERRVHFLGPRETTELKEVYWRSHVLVLPSSAEALPTVVTEALLCGTPVVATDVGGVRDQLGGFGIVVPPERPDELAGAIQHVLDNYDQFTNRGEEMARYARERFSIENMVQHHLELYQSLLNKDGPRRRHSVSGMPMNTIARWSVRLLCKTK